MTHSQSIEGNASQANRDFHGAAMIAADGREISITEEMISQTLDELHAS